MLIRGEIMTVINIIPLNDTWNHLESVDCWCAPKVQSVEGNSLVIHNADDRRELFENVETN
jgi:hypothetical protein